VKRTWTLQLTDRMGNKRFLYRDEKNASVQCVSKDELCLSLSCVTSEAAALRMELELAENAATALSVCRQYCDYVEAALSKVVQEVAR
jgi:hypothetical protein